MFVRPTGEGLGSEPHITPTPAARPKRCRCPARPSTPDEPSRSIPSWHNHPQAPPPIPPHQGPHLCHLAVVNRASITGPHLEKHVLHAPPPASPPNLAKPCLTPFRRLRQTVRLPRPQSRRTRGLHARRGFPPATPVSWATAAPPAVRCEPLGPSSIRATAPPGWITVKTPAGSFPPPYGSPCSITRTSSSPTWFRDPFD